MSENREPLDRQHEAERRLLDAQIADLALRGELRQGIPFRSTWASSMAMRLRTELGAKQAQEAYAAHIREVTNGQAL